MYRLTDSNFGAEPHRTFEFRDVQTMSIFLLFRSQAEIFLLSKADFRAWRNPKSSTFQVNPQNSDNSSQNLKFHWPSSMFRTAIFFKPVEQPILHLWPTKLISEPRIGSFVSSLAPNPSLCFDSRLKT